MATRSHALLHWPLSAAVVCLGLGVFGGSLEAGRLDPGARAQLVETTTETALVICLFCAGLRLRLPLQRRAWRVPLRLVLITLPASILLIAGAGNVLFHLGFGPALLLGAILAPTDAVLAADVRLPPGEDCEAARGSLIAEGALGSALAFPALIFGLGLLGLSDPGPAALRWVGLHVLWAIGAALVLGWLAGAAVARLLARLDTDGRVGLVEVLLLAATVAAAYGVTRELRANGLLAVLCTGFAVARGGRIRSIAPRMRMVTRLQALALSIQRVAGLGIVLLLGALLAASNPRPAMFVFALLVLALVRPAAVYLGLARLALPQRQRQVVEWFGVRAIAPVYLLMYAVDAGLSAPLARTLTAITLAVLVTSIALHSLMALPLVDRRLDQEG